MSCLNAKRSFLLAALVGGLALPSVAQLRVLTHNVTNYGTTSGRVSDFQTAYFGVFEGRSAHPDLFFGQEFLTASALATFLTAMNTAPGSPGTYAAVPFIDGPDTDSVCVYRQDKLVFLGQTVVIPGGTTPQPPRNVIRYDFHLAGYTQSGTAFSAYSVHMKAGQTQDDLARRLREAQLIRSNAETLGRPFLIAGDFNVQTSNETSYVELTGSKANNLGRFFDPIKTPGTWNNASGFRFVHTQDPVTGFAGMDDRYDFILFSSGLVDGTGFDYKGNPSIAYSLTTWNDPNHSYRAWGNDGGSFNTALRVAGNTMVGPTIAQALINTAGGDSGHLPVLLDMLVPGKAGVPAALDLGYFKLGQPAQRTFSVSNTGDVQKWTINGIARLSYSMSASSGFLVPGGQFDALAGAGNQHLIQVDTSTPGIKTGTVTVQSNDPDAPTKVIPVTAFVLPRTVRYR